MGLSVAIVGSGPSGFYTAESILERRPDATIDIIDRLPTPYGLIRAGVAPDHAKTKNVARAYEKIAQHPNVRFVGNVDVGRDVSVAAGRWRRVSPTSNCARWGTSRMPCRCSTRRSCRPK